MRKMFLAGVLSALSICGAAQAGDTPKFEIVPGFKISPSPEKLSVIVPQPAISSAEPLVEVRQQWTGRRLRRWSTPTYSTPQTYTLPSAQNCANGVCPLPR
jgi:hypothetical protein